MDQTTWYVSHKGHRYAIGAVAYKTKEAAIAEARRQNNGTRRRRARRSLSTGSGRVRRQKTAPVAPCWRLARVLAPAGPSPPGGPGAPGARSGAARRDGAQDACRDGESAP